MSSKKSEPSELLAKAINGFLLMSSAYLVGNLNFSYTWLLFGLFVYLVWSKSHHERPLVTDRNLQGMTQSKVIKPAVGDMDSCEWLNKFLAQLWPYLDDNITKLLYKQEGNIEKSLPYILQSFCIEKSKLGSLVRTGFSEIISVFHKVYLTHIRSQPFRISSVKCHDNTKKDEIVMDFGINYAGNCDFEVSIRGIKAGIKDIKLNGILRVEFKPLTKDVPIVHGLKAYFLTTPTVDFDLTNAADILDLPGISDLLRSAILDQIESRAVYPNKIHIPVEVKDLPKSENVEKLEKPEIKPWPEVEKEIEKSAQGIGKIDSGKKLVTFEDEAPKPEKADESKEPEVTHDSNSGNLKKKGHKSKSNGVSSDPMKPVTPSSADLHEALWTKGHSGDQVSDEKSKA
ncbi:Extended synaptotagmin-1 [Halotydeus destructor]|nr:Extended synaptotagmin-1 [Halotydeus destructor]